MRGLKLSGLLLVWMAVVSLAIPAFSQAQGASADQYVAYANQLYGAKNYTQALQYYSYAAKLDPNNAAAYQGIGYCYYATGNQQNALPYLQRAVQLNPNNAQLAQFVQSLQGQAGAPAASTAPASAAPAAAPAGQDAQYVAYGNQLYTAKNYAQALQYYGYAIKLNPNNANAYQGAGYCYYATGNKQYALYYLQKALQLNPGNAQLAQLVQSMGGQAPGTTVAAAVTATPTPAKNGATFGVHIFGGTSYVFANPSQIIDGATKGLGAGAVGNPAGGVTVGAPGIGSSASISLTGVTPSMIALAGIEPYVQLGQNFEINLNVSYLPIGNLSYSYYDYSLPQQQGVQDGYSYVYNNTGLMFGLGAKILFGSPSIRGYFGIGGDVAPISMTFTKVPIDITGSPTGAQTASSGNYSTVAIGGHAKLGVDFYLGKDIAVGPFVGFQYLSTTNYSNSSGGVLSVNPNNGDVDLADTAHTQALVLDYTSVNGGVNLTFSF